MIKLFTRLLTNNLKSVPLFYVEFDYKKFKKFGKENSCTCVTHPALKSDEHIKETLQGLVDYIRDNYDMEDII